MALKPVDNVAPKQTRRTISLRGLMVLGFGGLVALSVGGVLAMSVYANFTNTLALLNKQAIQLIDGMQETIDRDAAEGERVVSGLARLYANGEFDIGDDQSMQPIITALLMSEPVVETIVVIKPDGQSYGLARTPEDTIRVLPGKGGEPSRGDRPGAGRPSGDGGHRRLGKPPEPRGNQPKPRSDGPTQTAGAGQPFPHTDKPVWRPPELINGILFHTVTQSLMKNGQIEGTVVASIGAHSLNRAVMEVSENEATTTFIANDDGHIIAHSRQPQLFKDAPTIAPHDFPDLAINAFAAGLQNITVEEDETIRIGRAHDANDNEYIFISKDITSMSDKPYALTAYFDAAEISAELERVTVSALIGMAAFLLAVALAILFGNRLSRPLRNIATSASQFANLELDGYKPLPRSPVREIDDQTSAMNAMHVALSEFGQYVPRELVRRLLQSGTEATRSVEREITVMFTDVAGFTAMSEHMNAGDVVMLLNEHFDLLCDRISSNKGTVDKFMGDGLMAFWGAPEADTNHARHAIEAATEIVAAFHAGNAKRRAAGLKPLRLRMGLHTGRAVIGNIGGSDRHNYTVVGDVVNVASRLEQLGKELNDGDDVIACVSADCRRAAGDPPVLVAAGSHELRGRTEPISVFVLRSDEPKTQSEKASTQDLSA